MQISSYNRNREGMLSYSRTSLIAEVSQVPEKEILFLIYKGFVHPRVLYPR